jgi:purine-binding chemotaxis protein CheW
MTVGTVPKSPAPAQSGVSLLLVKLGDRQYGLPLACVQRVLPMAFVLGLPNAGDGLLGMLNLHGQVLAVIDPHPRLGLASPKLGADHRLVLLTGDVPFLLWVDEVDAVVTGAADALSVVPGQQASPLIPHVLRLGDTIVPVLAPTALEPCGTPR